LAFLAKFQTPNSQKYVKFYTKSKNQSNPSKIPIKKSNTEASSQSHTKIPKNRDQNPRRKKTSLNNKIPKEMQFQTATRAFSQIHDFQNKIKNKLTLKVN
jgi:hypothetical protein